MIRTVILDDHLMVLEGLNSMLEGHKTIMIESVFNKGKDLLNYLESNSPDVLLLDINLPDSNGIELCGIITKKYPSIAIIGLSNYSETNFIKNMIINGAKGYLLKNTTQIELIEAIRTVYTGEQFISTQLKSKLINESFGTGAKSFIPKLTRREHEVLQFIANELTNNEIADQLHISTKTVESHRKNLLQKFGCRNTAGLIKEAFTKGLLS